MSPGIRSDGPRRSRATVTKRRRAREGLETGPDGAVIGQDPRRLSTAELRELGHRGKPLLQAMRRRCVDCCGGKVDEVRRCTAVACPLWPYRMGTDPWQAEAPKAARERQPVVPAPMKPERAPEPAAVPVPPARRRRRASADAPRLPFLDDATT